MKVFFEKGQTLFPKGGKKEGITYCYYRQYNVCKGRKYYEVPSLPQHAKIISLEKLTLEIWHQLPLRIKHDFSAYARLYKVQYPDLRRKHLNSYGIFLKIIHKIDRYYLLSKRDDASYNLYVLLFGHYSVMDYIKCGFLLPVKDGYRLNARITELEKEYTLLERKMMVEIGLFEVKPGLCSRGLQAGSKIMKSEGLQSNEVI